MRFHKKVKPFYFVDDGIPLRQEMQSIKISSHPDIVERIYAKYPYIKRAEIATIVLATFEVLRDLLLRGCILTIKKLMMNGRIHFFQHTENGIAYSAVKVKIGTPTEWITKENFDD